MPDDHSEVVPLLPIPNRTVKRLCADDSADSRVKVGHRQALIPAQNPQQITLLGVLLYAPRFLHAPAFTQVYPRTPLSLHRLLLHFMPNARLRGFAIFHITGFRGANGRGRYAFIRLSIHRESFSR